MSTISKSITLRVPPDIIYRALKDTRLERIFPEFFIGVTRRIKTDKVNSELRICTTTEDSQIEVNETFKLRISGESNTDVGYITQTNVDTDNLIVQSILQTHIANIVYSLLTLEIGYINGLLKQNQNFHFNP
ncbi:MAG TPA: hypothetical protein VE130_08720 [Nitrososphaeraceae archaeon]|nr:hypothetical protein [Nitrososphaeraceae archaeon]